ncbi:tRNA uridine-5-carboxymethylaminomethyl(34) synthesis GTPase MnmE [cyanobiont of Ornithocercus magnificus]|nr:tRNA uridine-5-carboxymethylaminomethyl(34) synthesis GTPase MnmE [cyanobiont of Ornithocercus magnificus]
MGPESGGRVMSGQLTAEATIAAVATAVAPGQGSIAIVRISGPKAEATGRAVVRVPGSQSWDSHRVLYGHVLAAKGSERLDEVLLLLMRAPRSFTGEDVVEIHCHGGIIAVQAVLERVLNQPGVRRALPGEFSQRAVLNGRLSLTQAEAISDLVAARSRRAARMALAVMDGGIQARVNVLRDRLLEQLSQLEARIDFEENLPPLNSKAVLRELCSVRVDLEELVADANRGRSVRQGLRIALIGRPNVGKSSLLNRLSRRERAIVTDLPGTTRDLLESEIVLDGVPVVLLDTAGIHHTDNAVERLGIARSLAAIDSADLVVLVVDLQQGWTAEDTRLLQNIPGEIPVLIVGNKVDLVGTATSTNIQFDVSLSAVTGAGENELVHAILQRCGALHDQSLLLALNDRQQDLATTAIQALQRSEVTATEQLPWDFWSIDLRQAIHSLGEITGQELTESVLERIFSHFCIGK